jgi:hypothetical protein
MASSRVYNKLDASLGLTNSVPVTFTFRSVIFTFLLSLMNTCMAVSGPALPQKKQVELREKYNINNFRSLYTFYYPGFNLRSTDLQAFIGLEQLKKLDMIVENRNKNFLKILVML